MRECGGCTLCCKVLRVEELKKPSNEWCRFCDEGCTIYEWRPQGCKNFRCWWLDHEEMSEELRPDRVHMFAEGEGEVVKLRVDTDFSWAWKGSPVVDYFRERHMLIVVGNQMTFLPSKGLPPLSKIMVEWTL
jgi:hypothetical protein